MVSTSADILRTGRARAGRGRISVQAGPVRAELEGADLRLVTVGDVELVQRVYVAVRDAPWNTIPATYRGWVHEIADDRFRVAFSASHRHGEIAFDWDATITGTPDGQIRYVMDGVCRGVFQYSKIGFNVHHALAGAVGRAYRAQTEKGELRGTLPREIDPQRIVDGTLSGMIDRKSTRLNSSHIQKSRMPSTA